MSDSEDWRRQRAEELRLHDAGPLAAQPARDRQPAVEGVEPMRRPVVAPPAPAPPLSTEATSGQREQRRGAEPAARRYRPQAPLLSGSDAAAPHADSAALAPRRPATPSFATRHPLALGSLVAAALAGAGALGWTLRGDTSPVTTSAPMTRVVPSGSPSSSGVPVNRVPVDRAPPPVAPDRRNSQPVAAIETVPLARAETAPLVSKRTKAAVTTVSRRVREQRIDIPKATATATASSLPRRPDKTSRFAHPAKAVALAGRGFSPSFNCRRAIAAVNRAICANPALSALDRQVSQAFYRATANADLERHKAIDRDQVDFLNQRATCNSDECVARVYRQRLAALREAGPGE